MTILEITETKNEDIKTGKPIKEKMDIYIPDIPEGISRRNGAIYILTGSGGSGKTSLLLNQFRKGGAYNKKFHHIYYYCPNASFTSVAKHPFEKHDKVYHELTYDNLVDLRGELMERKEEAEEDDEQEYSCVIIDDFANSLKDKDIVRVLNSLLIKARHLNCSFIFTLQSIMYFPKILRRQITYATIFKPKNSEEWAIIRDELLQLKDVDAKKIYDYVFDADYNNLSIDCFSNKLYKNFNLLNIANSNSL